MSQRKDRSLVTVAHRGILSRARVPRSALKHMSPGWRVVGSDAPAKPSRRRVAAKKTSRQRTGETETKAPEQQPEE